MEIIHLLNLLIMHFREYFKGMLGSTKSTWLWVWALKGVFNRSNQLSNYFKKPMNAAR